MCRCCSHTVQPMRQGQERSARAICQYQGTEKPLTEPPMMSIYILHLGGVMFCSPIFAGRPRGFLLLEQFLTLNMTLGIHCLLRCLFGLGLQAGRPC